MKKIIVIVTLVVFCFTAMAQQNEKQKPATATPTTTATTTSCTHAAASGADPVLIVKDAETIVIQTNAYSSKSNTIFSENLPYLKGVKDFKYDEKSYKIAVAYDPKKTNPEAIRIAIAKLGFDADQIKANEQSRAKLPQECKTMPKGCSHSCGHTH
jgi:copper chaperone CopZ